MVVMEGEAVVCAAEAETEVVAVEVVVEVEERSRRICAVASEPAGGADIVVEHVVVADTTAVSRLETCCVAVAEHLPLASSFRSCSCGSGTQCSPPQQIPVRQR
jgi:hypothetical protein